MQAAEVELELERSRHENDMLISIASATVAGARHPVAAQDSSRSARAEVTNADGGSSYIVIGSATETSRNRKLRFVGVSPERIARHPCRAASSM